MNSPYDQNIRDAALGLSKQLISYINAAGLVIGIIAMNISDVVFGGVMLSMLFKDIDILFGSPTDGWLLGFSVSLSFWAIQMLMWGMIFSDGIVTLKDAVPLVLSIIVAIVDTNIDVAPVFLWISRSEIGVTLQQITIFGGKLTLYDLVLWSVLVGFYLVTGFGELFNSWYLSKIKSNTFTLKLPARRNKPKPKMKPSRRAQLQQEYGKKQPYPAAPK